MFQLARWITSLVVVSCCLQIVVSDLTEIECFEPVPSLNINEVKVITITPECVLFVGQPGDVIPALNATQPGPSNRSSLKMGKCNQYAVRRIRVDNIGQRRMHYILMAIARRGARLLLISLPAQTMRIQKNHRMFHHYSNMVTGAHSIHTFVTIADYLFVSTIHEKKEICLKPVQFSLHLNKLSIEIMQHADFCIPHDIAPPAHHTMDSFQAADKRWILAIRYTGDINNVVLVRVEDIFTPDATADRVDYTTYTTYANVLKMKTNHLECAAKFGGFSAYRHYSSDIVELRRIVSKTLPSRREGYPFTIAYQDQFGAKQESNGFGIFLGLFLGGIVVLVVQWILSSREEAKRRKEIENSNSRSKSTTKSNSKM